MPDNKPNLRVIERQPSKDVNKTVVYHVIQNDAAVSYVGFWRRAFAQIIDALVLGFALYLIRDEAGNVNQLLGFIVSLLYYSLLPATKLKGTIGKLAIGAAVVNSNGGQMSYLQSLGRFFSTVLSFFLCFIGVIMVGFNNKKRGLHDMMAGTYVVNRK